MDVLIGRILEALDELDLREQTIVLFTGDNATAGLHKGRLTDQGVRVPLIVNGPGRVKAGIVSNALVDLSDVLPTLAELAGAPLPEDVTFDGRSFASVLRGDSVGVREWIFSYEAYQRMLRDERWLLEGDGRLFDCGGSRDRAECEDVTDSTEPEAIAARQRFDCLLDRLPAPPRERSHP
jgi:arylsulfatase A-like enzyme